MLLTRFTAPVETPVSRSEAKAHLRVEHTEDDTLIDALVATAVAEIDGREGYLRRALVTQTWDYSILGFPVERKIYLPFPPLQSVTSIKYFDATNTEQTLDLGDCYIHANAFVGYVNLKPGKSWPATTERDDAVTLRFVCGYGNAAAVPSNIKHAILLRLTELYAFRGDDGEAPGMSPAVYRLLQPSRLVLA